MKVIIYLVAHTRKEASMVLEVPNNITNAQLDELVQEKYRDSDGIDFVDDNEYWEQGHCSWERLNKIKD